MGALDSMVIIKTLNSAGTQSKTNCRVGDSLENLKEPIAGLYRLADEESPE
jgi:hypothetical protein